MFTGFDTIDEHNIRTHGRADTARRHGLSYA